MNDTTYDALNELPTVWEEEVYTKLRRQVQVAWRIAIGAIAFAALCIIAIIIMLPLKTSVPYVVTVDSQTGYIEETTALQAGVSSLTRDESLLHHNIARYVIARETYDPQSVTDHHKHVSLHSAENALSDFAALWGDAENPGKKYGRKIRVKTTIKSISLINDYTANVRFKTTHLMNNGKTIKTNHHAAILQWVFTETPKKMADRLKNPLGFKITNYRVDQESTD